MAITSSDHYACRIISPSVVLEHRLDGEDLAWLRDHLRRCEACRQLVEVFRERRLREGGLAIDFGAIPATPGLLASLSRRASAYRDRVGRSRRYAVVALMAALLAGFFVSSSPRFAADAVKQSQTASAVLDTGSVEVTQPSTLPSSAAPQPTALPATSQDRPVPTVVAPSSHPAPAPAPVSTPTPVVDARPVVILTVTPLSGLAPLTVTADASRSTDTDATGIASYSFDFGDGTPHAWGGAAQHKYCVAGIYRLTVVVTDTAGLSSSAFVYVNVTQPVNPVSC